MGSDGQLRIVDVAEVGEDALLVHDPERADSGLAFSLARLAEDPTGPTPIGIFRDVERPVYGRGERFNPTAGTDEDLAELLTGRRNLDRRIAPTDQGFQRRTTIYFHLANRA